MKSRHPLLETLVAVACVAAAAVLTALPSSDKTGERNVDLQDSLSVMRTAVFRFSMDHEIDSQALLPGLGGEDVEQQLLGLSRTDGTTQVNASMNGAEDRYFGPYLVDLPVNPVNGLSSVRSMPAGYTEPVLNGSAGWVYVPATGKVYADLPGADRAGVPYATY